MEFYHLGIIPFGVEIYYSEFQVKRIKGVQISYRQYKEFVKRFNLQSKLKYKL